MSDQESEREVTQRLSSAAKSEKETKRRQTSASDTKPSTSELKALEAGQQFGRYRVKRLLGEGGMGAVYLAHDLELDRAVAIKIPKLADEGQGAKEIQQRFIQEARSAATLTHPNLCPIFDVGKIQGQLFLCMPYIEGQGLDRITRKGKPVGPKVAAQLIRKIAIALAEAHAKGVIHRDLKPSNIMISKRKEPIIMDFGLARREQSADPKLTQTGVVMGTPAYMSPEQISGVSDQIGPQTDIYSLGVLLYELLTGEVPFQGRGLSVISKILTEEPKFQPDRDANIDPRLKAICLKAVSKQLSTRYATMNELAEDLSAYLKDSISNAAAASTPQSKADDPLGIDSSMIQASQPQPGLAASAPWAKIKTEPKARTSAKSKKLVVGGIVAGCVLLFVVLAALGVTFILQTPSGTLIVELSEPSSDAVLTIDGRRFQIAEGRSQVTVEAGNHELIVTSEGFETITKSVTVERGKQPIVYLELVRTPSRSPTEQDNLIADGGTSASEMRRDRLRSDNREANGEITAPETGSIENKGVETGQSTRLSATSEDELKQVAEELSKADSKIETVQIGPRVTITKSMNLDSLNRSVAIEGSDVQPGLLDLIGEGTQLTVRGDDTTPIRLSNLILVDNRPEGETPPLVLSGQVVLDNCIIVSRGAAMAIESGVTTLENSYFWQAAFAETDLVLVGTGATFAATNSLFVGSRLIDSRPSADEKPAIAKLQRCTFDGFNFLTTCDSEGELEIQVQNCVSMSHGVWPRLSDSSLNKTEKNLAFSAEAFVFLDLPPEGTLNTVQASQAEVAWQTQTDASCVFRQFPVATRLKFLFDKQHFYPPTASVLANSMLEEAATIGADLAQLPHPSQVVLQILPEDLQAERFAWENLLQGQIAGIPSFPKIHLVGEDGPDVNELIEAYTSAQGNDTIEICTNDPYVLDAALLQRSQPYGTLTIRAGEGFQPVIARRGLSEGALIKMNSSANDPSLAPKLRLQGLTLVDPNPATQLTGENQPYRFRLVETVVARLEATQCVFMDSRGGLSGRYNQPSDDPQMLIYDCYFYHLPVNTDQGVIGIVDGHVKIQNCLCVKCEMFSFDGNVNAAKDFPKVLIDIESCTFVECFTLGWASNAQASIRFVNNIVSGTWCLWGYQTLVPSVEKYFDFNTLENNLYFNCEMTIFTESQGMNVSNGLDNNSPAVRVYRRIVGLQDTKSPFYRQEAFNRRSTEKATKSVVPAALFHVPRKYQAMKVGANTDRLPALAPGIVKVLPAEWLDDR